MTHAEHPRAKVSRALRATTQAAERFALTPASARPLAALRIGLAAVLLVQAAFIAPAYLDLYGKSGILQASLRDALAGKSAPGIGWLADRCASAGVSEPAVLLGVGGLYVLSLLALLAGFRTRLVAPAAFLTHFALMDRGDSTIYGADQLAHVFLFYLCLAPCGTTLSLDRRRKLASAEATRWARIALRVVQAHLSMIYLASGVEKATGSQWWDGDAIWRSLMLPEYRMLDFSWLAAHPLIPKLAGWSVLAVEIGYPLMIWHKKTRRLWLAAAVAMHLGIAAFMGLGIFGAVMVVFNVALFGVSADPGPAAESRKGLGDHDRGERRGSS